MKGDYMIEPFVDFMRKELDPKVVLFYHPGLEEAHSRSGCNNVNKFEIVPLFSESG